MTLAVAQLPFSIYIVQEPIQGTASLKDSRPSYVN